MHRRHILSTLLGLAAWSLLPRTAAAAAWMRVEANVDRSLMRGDIDINAFLDLPGETGSAWSVLTDYDRLAEFVPGMRVSRVVSGAGEPIRVYQRGEKSWLLAGAPLELLFQMEETPATRIRFRMLSGNINNMIGEWRIAPQGTWMRITYRAQMRPGLLTLRAPGDRFLIEKDIEDMLKAIGREILRRGSVASRP